MRALCSAEGIAVASLEDVGLLPDPVEDALEVHPTFEANARAKARWFAGRLPGRAVVADDSGLVVDALDGAPGVRSKRWAGSAATGRALDDANNAALVAALAGVPRARRTARYVCVVVAVFGDREWVARGTCEGWILESPRGSGGFGYDPYFESRELARAFGEVTREEKAAVSHRGRAFRALLASWRGG